MAIHLELVYGKKLGLPMYSSHNFSVSLKSEVASLNDIPREVERVYGILQKSVDEQIVHPGFIPGSEEAPANNVVQMPKAPPPAQTEWRCSPKQKELICKLVDEQKLDRSAVDAHARERYGKGVIELNKLEASGLIDELMGGGSQRNRKPNQRRAA